MEFIELIEEVEAAEAVLPIGRVIRDRTNPFDAYDDDRFCFQVFPQIFQLTNVVHWGCGSCSKSLHYPSSLFLNYGPNAVGFGFQFFYTGRGGVK